MERQRKRGRKRRPQVRELSSGIWIMMLVIRMFVIVLAMSV